MPKRQITPPKKPDQKAVDARLERERARQANYDLQAERNAEALAKDPGQQALYEREKNGAPLLQEGKRDDSEPANKKAAPPVSNKSATPRKAARKSASRKR